ncbi:glycoside hydrolase family 5 protein [Lactifluus volemus]|nr:glycoside hydrolase family 5 protein [Lactifluus volemus]
MLPIPRRLVLLAVATAAVALACFPTTAFAFSSSFEYGSVKVRGVSLGGWLVLEPWITPSLFDNTGNPNIVDEWSFAELQDRNVAQEVLETHWLTWITERDFATIAAAGLNHVRVPIGYWAWDVQEGEPYIQGQLPYLRNAVGWAARYGLKVVIDLHGVPGSQNGYAFDNSGHRIPFPEWQSSQSNIDRTNNILRLIAAEFAPLADVVSAIQPVNEPAGYDGPAVLNAVHQYYLSSYSIMRQYSANTLQMIHDAFQPLTYWYGWERPPNFQGVALDTHIYQIFSNGGVAQSQSQHISTACSEASNLVSSNQNLWTVVGEWSPAMTDCAKYLNGRGTGSRYDGSYPGSSRVGSCTGLTGSGASFSESYKVFLRQIWEAQVITYEKASGWIMWTWKTEDADEWSYEAGLTYGWIPRDPSSHEYPNICG